MVNEQYEKVIYRKENKVNKTLGTGSVDRSARVHRIKRVIIGLIVIAVILPSILCIILFSKINRLEKQIIELSYQRERVNVITESTKMMEPNKAEPNLDEISSEIINIEKVELEDSTDEQHVDLKEPEEIEISDESENDSTIESEDNSEDKSELKLENRFPLKRVYLTFDDGPSSNTSKILDILNDNDVKGTFFVVGRLSDTTTPMYKRIVDEGHAIGMHSYTHKYSEVYADKDAFVYDVEKIQSLIYEQTGVLSKLYRFPGGSSNTVSRTPISELTAELEKRDIKFFDWNVTSGDASSRYGVSKEAIIKNCTSGALGFEDAVILMHDLPEKSTTVAALPEIIGYFKSIGVEILPLDENAPGVHHIVEISE